MIKKIVFFLFIIYFAFFSKPNSIFAEDCDPNRCGSDDSSCLREVESSCLKKLNELGTAKDTLANQIKILNSQYELTLLKISQTENSIKSLEKEIANLTVEISKLNINLNQLSSVYVLQIVQNYKLEKKIPPFAYLISSKLNNFLAQYKYVSNAQKASQNSLIKLETVRSNYDAQKTAKAKKQSEMETLQKTLASQRVNLNNQRSAKDNLLNITKNDEKKYQKLLDDARSELAAINAILSGNNIINETKVGSVSEGQRIASVISGSSCSSSGTHLHFMVTKNDEPQNPFNYLKPIDYVNCSTNSCGSSGDPFNPSGNWNWPLSPQIKFNQGYGNSWAVKNTWVRNIYSFHNGIDIAGSSSSVTSPISGTLWRGSYHIKSGNCYLRYVKVVGENGISTLNLHINY